MTWAPVDVVMLLVAACVTLTVIMSVVGRFLGLALTDDAGKQHMHALLMGLVTLLSAYVGLRMGDGT